MARSADIAIVGGGIVGLATTVALTERHPRARITLLDKEPRVAGHQTGHNSGVIHSGIYYKPGSYKARLCVEGARLMTEFCDAHGIGWERCGKVIVATEESERPQLEALYERGTANGVPGLKVVSGDEVREHEPNCRAVAGLLSPHTGIVDYVQVAEKMAALVSERGVEIRTGARVHAIRRAGDSLVLETGQGPVEAGHLINCAGLHSDRVAEMMGIRPEV
ncbi:MAG TPA: FAD-dependent oxidoreductase, partial [Candidatus Binatia bacterium]|nr:FAD-dependent oxidoreductase [Candidatus Binatia bacterium]